MVKYPDKVSVIFESPDDSVAELNQILETVVERVKSRMAECTPRQRVLAEFLVQSPESVGFLSINTLATEVGVSEATIFRFCKELGYEGYADLSHEVQQSIQYKLSTVGRFKLIHKLGQSTTKGHLSAFERVVAHEMENLAKLSRSIKKADFDKCIKLMAKAKRIFVVGCMGSASLAYYFGYMLSKILPGVVTLNGSGGLQSTMVAGFNSDSLVFLLAFPRYPRATVEIGEWALQKGARIVAITDSHASPIVPLAAISFLIPVGIASFVDAYAAPVTFLNTLVTEFSERDADVTERALKQFEAYAGETAIFTKSTVKMSWPKPEKD
jgi:DNA-binding MurR/RpiR family transcriptional regulator